jgi:hypothetical protein
VRRKKEATEAQAQKEAEEAETAVQSRSSENEYFPAAFRYLRSEGYAYQGAGLYTRHGRSYRIRAFAAWRADPSKGYVESLEQVSGSLMDVKA